MADKKRERRVRTAKMWAAGKVNPRDHVHLLPSKNYAAIYGDDSTATRVTITWKEPPPEPRPARKTR